MGRQGRRRKQLLDDVSKTRDIRSHAVENSLWRKLWTCRKTDCGMMMMMMMSACRNENTKL